MFRAAVLVVTPCIFNRSLCTRSQHRAAPRKMFTVVRYSVPDFCCMLYKPYNAVLVVPYTVIFWRDEENKTNLVCLPILVLVFPSRDQHMVLSFSLVSFPFGLKSFLQCFWCSSAGDSSFSFRWSESGFASPLFLEGSFCWIQNSGLTVGHCIVLRPSLFLMEVNFSLFTCSLLRNVPSPPHPHWQLFPPDLWFFTLWVWHDVTNVVSL